MANLTKKNKKGIYKVNIPGAVTEGLKGAARDVAGLSARVAVGATTGITKMSGLPEGEVTKKLRAATPNIRNKVHKVGSWLTEEREPVWKGFKKKKQQTSDGYMYK